MDVAKTVVVPTASLVLDHGDGEVARYEGHKAGGKRRARFCTYECCRAWVLKNYPPVQRHEVLVLIDIVSGRLVGLAQKASGAGRGRLKRPRTAPGRM